MLKQLGERTLGNGMFKQSCLIDSHLLQRENTALTMEKFGEYYLQQETIHSITNEVQAGITRSLICCTQSHLCSIPALTPQVPV